MCPRGKERAAVSYHERIDSPGPKRLLALDGGGIRGVITLEILARLERELRAARGEPGLVLADYFDYVAGTSTGAIIAAAIATGMDVGSIRTLYHEAGPEMFTRSRLRDRVRHLYDADPLAQMLQRELGADTTLGSDRLRCLLMVVLRNASTDSAWPLSNNPRARFNDPALDDCNLLMPLWQVVRASTAAPVYFPPERVRLGTGDGAREFVFVDGGVTPYNNPAFQLFLMATLDEYALRWATGEERLLLVSVGTGNTAFARPELDPRSMTLLHHATAIPPALMMGAAAQQDLLCRVVGRCRAGPPIDAEVGDLIGSAGIGDGERHFTYVRYDSELTRTTLTDLGFADVRPGDVLAIDKIDHVDTMHRIGQALAERDVDLAHLDGFL
jgi:uncharacterized protein